MDFKNINEKYLDCLKEMYLDCQKRTFTGVAFYVNLYGISSNVGRALQNLGILQKSSGGDKFSRYTWKVGEPDMSMAIEVKNKTSEVAQRDKNGIPYNKNLPQVPIKPKLTSVKEVKMEAFDQAYSQAIADTSKAIMLLEIAGIDFTKMPKENQIKFVKELSKK